MRDSAFRSMVQATAASDIGAHAPAVNPRMTDADLRATIDQWHELARRDDEGNPVHPESLDAWAELRARIHTALMARSDLARFGQGIAWGGRAYLPERNGSVTMVTFDYLD